MPETIQSYLETVEGQIRWRRARPAVSLELRRHLEDQMAGFAAEGLEDAERLAVEEMGDPVSVGAELDRLHRPRPQWGLLGLTAALACVGAFLRVWITRGDGIDAADPAKTALALALGTAALLGTYFLDVSFLARHPRAIYVGALAAGVLSFFLLPRVANAFYYTRYIISLYPVVFALWLYSCRGNTWRRFATAVAGGIPLVLVTAAAPSLFGLLTLLFCGLILLLCAIRMGWFGRGRWRFAGTALALAVGIPLLFLGMGYGEAFARRLYLALHPEADPKGAGYAGMVVKMFLQDVPAVRKWNDPFARSITVGTRGRLFYDSSLIGGTGSVELSLGQEFIPLRLLAECGWLVYLVLLAAITALLAWLLVRCLRQRQHLGRLIALAVVLRLGLETLSSVALSLGFVFVPSHLPLVVGNLHTVLDMALIGLVLSVFRGGSILRDEPPVGKSPSVFPWRVKILIVSKKEP